MFRRWLAKLIPHAPVNRAVDVTFDERGITCRRASGLDDHFEWSDLQSVVIRTTNRGPFDEDVFIVLSDAAASCWIPQAIAHHLLERLQQLPGFDNQAVIEAMCCAENNEFVCWTREAEA